MRQQGELQNRLRTVRTRLGLSQQDLAQAAGVTRQTIGGIEGAQYSPSATVALRLARVLGCRVEDLFWLEEALPTLDAVPASGLENRPTGRVSLARVAGRWIAHPLAGDAAFRAEMVPADGLLSAGGEEGSVRVDLLDEPLALARTVMLAGCAPALSLWARAAERWHPGLRVQWTFANSMEALAALARGEVHAAGLHLWDAGEAEYNAPFVRRALPGRAVVLLNLGVWEEGLVVRPGNPRGLARGSDLARADVRVVNREEGSGARLLLDQLLADEGVPPGAVRGFDRVVSGHLEVAREVAAGRADAGVTSASVAATYGLGFVPLREVRYDLAVLKQSLSEEPVRQLLGTLDHRWVRTQLSMLGGYDTLRTGEIVAELPAA